MEKYFFEKEVAGRVDIAVLIKKIKKCVCALEEQLISCSRDSFGVIQMIVEHMKKIAGQNLA